MFIPIPILIFAGVAFLVMAAQILRRSRRRDPLLGGAPPVLRPAPLPARDVSPIMPSTTLPPEIEAQIRALLAAGRKVEAVKLARDTTHLGLKDSKDLVETFE
jgi:large subunit ribosomal protein L7/L12